ncbi:MAG: ubiquinol-cytochrome c reductase iron-sulfur subunit [Acidobacteriota bacterium]
MAVTRRVVNWLLGGSIAALTGAILYPVVRFISPPDMPEATVNQVEAGPTNDPELLENGFKIVRFGNQPVILVRVAEDDYRAFDGVCTHLDCIVEYQQDQTRIWCNCHNGEYNLQGEVVSGPPPHALEQYQVDLVPRSGAQAPMIVVSKT